jgi:hypothetical protein
MTGSSLQFVPTAGEAPPRSPGTNVVVIDTSWTPSQPDRADLRPLRPSVSAVLERIDLFRDTLERLDAWADATDVADRLTIDGVSWWFPIRPFLVDHLHERALLAHVVAGLLADTAAETLIVPEQEAPLVDVARAFERQGIAVTITPAPALASSAGPETPQVSAASGTTSRWPDWREWRRRRERRTRRTRIAARLTSLRSAQQTVLVIAQPRIYQTIRSITGGRRVDPQLAPVIDRLAARGLQPVVVGLELDPREDGDWAIVRDDDQLIPQSFVNDRWGVSEDRDQDTSGISAGLLGAGHVPLDVAGVDLEPVVLERLTRFSRAWLKTQLRISVRAERMMRDLRPNALFLNHEGIRTSWVAAARRADVPVFAVQHGLIFPWHSVYRHHRHRGLVLPARTFTYGPYESRTLVDDGEYTPDEVQVTGSPRSDVDADALADPRTIDVESANVRRELGVSSGDLMLVVSTAHTRLFRRYYLPHMIDRLLGGPLPGIHLVFKMHPGEVDDGPYRALIEGMAAAGAYPAPPISVVRDTDLYALLRAADAHLGLHSTVLTDAVAADTANLISVAQAYGDLLGYVAAGVARPVRDVAELREALATPRPVDPVARAAFLADHFMAGDASSRIADAIARGIEEHERSGMRPGQGTPAHAEAAS